MENDAAQVESIASADNELATATVARTNEETEYSRSEFESVGVVDTLNNFISTVSAVVDAAAFSSTELALDQSRHDDREFSAPAAAAHSSLSSDTADVLHDLLDRAQTQLDETSHPEPKVALGDQLAKDSQALAKSKADRAEFSTALAAEKADLPVTGKSLPAEEASQVARRMRTCEDEMVVLQTEFWWSAETDLFTDLEGFEVVMLVECLAPMEHDAALSWRRRTVRSVTSSFAVVWRLRPQARAAARKWPLTMRFP